MDRNEFTPQSKVWLSLGWFWRNSQPLKEFVRMYPVPIFFLSKSDEKCVGNTGKISSRYEIRMIINRVIILRIMRGAEHVVCIREGRGIYRVLVGKHEVKRLSGRRRLRWKANTKMDLKETGCGAWSGLIWLSTRTNGGLLCAQWGLRFL